MNPQDQPSDSSRERPELQPGQTVSPRENTAPQRTASAPILPAPTAPAPSPSPDEERFYHADNGMADERAAFESNEYAPAVPANQQTHHTEESVAWTASEFIAHEKSPQWYLAMAGAGSAVAAGVYLITRDMFNTVIVAIAGIIFGVAAGRQPRQMQYGVDQNGVSIGKRFYPYTDFRSFSIADDGAFRSIILMPLKRFMPQLSIYYDPAAEDRIAEVLAAHLPIHEHQHDMTEKLMRRIRF